MGIRTLGRKVAACLGGALLMLSLALPASAGRVETDTVLAEIEVQSQRAEVISALERHDVAAGLAEMGVDPDNARERVRRMSDTEIAALHGRLEEAKAGGVHGPVLGTALVVFILFVVTDAVGATDIFPFVRPVD